jgi:hypothetical protein
MALTKVLPENLDLAKGREIIQYEYWDGADINQLFVEGDHWQEGKGWVGPLPGGDTTRDVALTLLKETFTSRNVIKEVVGRHVDGLLGREPEWGFTVRRPLTADEQLNDTEIAAIDEIEAAFTTWWNDRDVLGSINTATEQMLWGKRSVIRIMVPAGLLTNIRAQGGRQAVGLKKAADLASALNNIWIETPLPSDATVYIDPDSKESIGVLITKDAEDNEVLEVSYLAAPTVGSGNGANGKVEAPQTALLRITKAGKATVTIQLGGKITMYEITRDPLITSQVQEQQRALNLAISMMPRTMVTSGFLERVILGGQAPGEWKEDPKTHDKYFVPDAYITGAGTTNFIEGKEYIDEEGKMKVTDPRIEWRDPSDPQGPIKGSRFHYQNILEEVDQEHILISGDAMASGKAREMARQGYVLSLKRTKKPVEALGRWLFDTVLAMAETFMQAPGKYSSLYRAYFNCRRDTGPVTAEERLSYSELVDKGMICLETAMHLVNIDDVDAELVRINQQEGHKLHIQKRLAEAIKAFVDATVPLEQALKWCGVEESEATRIATEAKAAKEEEAKREQENAIELTKAKAPEPAPSFGS